MGSSSTFPWLPLPDKTPVVSPLKIKSSPLTQLWRLSVTPKPPETITLPDSVNLSESTLDQPVNFPPVISRLISSKNPESLTSSKVNETTTSSTNASPAENQSSSNDAWSSKIHTLIQTSVWVKSPFQTWTMVMN